MPPRLGAGAGAVATQSFANVAYGLSESSISGYTPSAWSCVVGEGAAVEGASITLSEGESAVCTITNDDAPPTITLVKEVVNDNGGNAGVNDFGPVSYTHLTLPTSDLVEISVVAVSFKKKKKERTTYGGCVHERSKR